MSEKIVEFVTAPDGRIVSHPRGAAIKDGWHETTPDEIAAAVKAETDRVKAESKPAAK